MSYHKSTILSHYPMVVSWPERRGAHSMSKSCFRPGLVLSLVVGSGGNPNFNNSRNTPCCDRGLMLVSWSQLPVVIPAFMRYHFHRHEWLTSTSYKKNRTGQKFVIACEDSNPKTLCLHDYHVKRSAIQATVLSYFIFVDFFPVFSNKDMPWF